MYACRKFIFHSCPVNRDTSVIVTFKIFNVPFINGKGQILKIHT